MVKNTVKSEKKKVVKTNATKSNSDVEVINIDWRKTLKFLPIFFIVIAMFVALFVRVGPVSLNGLDDVIESNVYSNIQSNIAIEIDAKYPRMNDVYKQELILKEYNKVLETGVYEAEGQKFVVSDIVEAQKENAKSKFKAENGQTYLNAIDPYYFMRNANQQAFNNEDDIAVGIAYRTENLTGTVKEGQGGFHSWLFQTLYSINGVDSDSDVGENTAAIFLIPVIFSVLCVIPAFFIIRKYANSLSALFGSLLMVCIGTFVSRTVAGFVDTDAYNIFFPLVIVALIVEAIVSSNKYVKIGCSVLAGLVQTWYLWAWGNGWFIFLFAFVALVGYLIFEIIARDYLTLKNKILKLERETVELGSVILGYVVSSFAFVYLFLGRNIFSSVFGGISSSFDSIATVSGTYIWPNVFSSVAELNSASFSSIVSSVGGNTVFFLALCGILALCLDFKISKTISILKNTTVKKLTQFKRAILVIGFLWNLMIVLGLFSSISVNSSFIFLILMSLPIAVALLFRLACGEGGHNVFMVMLLTCWFLGTIYMSLNGVRFILLLAPAFAISFGIGMFYLMKYVNIFSKQLEIKGEFNQKIGGIVIATVVFLMLFVPVFNTAKAIGDGSTPNFDDAWYESMEAVRTNSTSDAIITSWWDFGHFFTAVGERSVTFDGGSQTLPQSHWVGKLLMENNESVSTDILRMLVCGGNGAFDSMMEITNDSSGGVLVNKVIYSTFGKTKSEKIEILKSNKYFKFTDSQVDDIMSKLYCENPRENFVVASEDMVGKAGVWAHWGSWDFTKKYVHDKYKSMSVSEIAKIVDENESVISTYVDQLKEIDSRVLENPAIKRDDLINKWFAPYPSYMQNLPCKVDEKTIDCGAFSLDLLSGKLDNKMPDQLKISNIVIPAVNNSVRNIEVGDEGGIDILLARGQSGFVASLMQAPLGNSLFTKLFYLNAAGLENFEVFSDKTSITGTRILIYKTKFE